MSDTAPIIDLSKYNHSMTKPLIDKIFFMDKVEADVFVDVGCADGHLIKFLARNFPQHKYIGFDNDYEMVEAANKENPDNILFTENAGRMLKALDIYRDKRICVILSSMIHEVYSYKRDVSGFFDFVFKDINPDAVAIRDMAVSNTASRPSDPVTVARIRQVFDPNKLSEWESQWGSIDENWSLTHFLLTYRYQNNWERELRENYLPITKEALLRMIPLDYHPILIEHYTLPFLRREVNKDFGIQLQERTHLKLILER